MYLPTNLTTTLLNISLALPKPDIVVCNNFYPAPELASNCQQAIDLLPTGPKPIEWANWVGPPKVRHPINLPLVKWSGRLISYLMTFQLVADGVLD